MTPGTFDGETIRILKEREEARAERDALRLLLTRALDYLERCSWGYSGAQPGSDELERDIKRGLEE